MTDTYLDDEFQLVKILKDGVDEFGVYRRVAIYRFKQRTFKFIFIPETPDTKNGLDDKHCIKVFSKTDDQWKILADCEDIQPFVEGDINYFDFNSPDAKKVKNDAVRFFAGCMVYLTAIYN